MDAQSAVSTTISATIWLRFSVSAYTIYQIFTFILFVARTQRRKKNVKRIRMRIGEKCLHSARWTSRRESLLTSCGRLAAESKWCFIAAKLNKSKSVNRKQFDRTQVRQITHAAYSCAIWFFRCCLFFSFCAENCLQYFFWLFRVRHHFDHIEIEYLSTYFVCIDPISVQLVQNRIARRSRPATG